MKTKKLLSLLFVAVLAVGFISCDSDDDEDEKENKFTYGDVNAKISSGLYNQGSEGDYTFFFLALVGEGLSINFEQEEASGSGYTHWIYLVSVDGTLEGEYSYTEPVSSPISTKEAIKSDLFYGYQLSYFTDGKNGSSIGDFNNRNTTVSIKKDGDKYEVVLTGKDEDGVAINLYYKGTLTKADIRS